MTASRVRITEIFHSIQGESTHAGRPCVFIRLTGCPLRCTWCDTEYAFHGGVDMTIDEVVARTQAYGCSLVEITGGGNQTIVPIPLDLMKALGGLGR